MDSSRLSHAQLSRLVVPLTRQRDYLEKLRSRMQQLGFKPDDPLYAAVARSWEAASDLVVKACAARNAAEKQSELMRKRPWAGE